MLTAEKWTTFILYKLWHNFSQLVVTKGKISVILYVQIYKGFADSKHLTTCPYTLHFTNPTTNLQQKAFRMQNYSKIMTKH